MPRKDPDEARAYGREYERKKRAAMTQEEIDAKNAETRAKRKADPERFRATDRKRNGTPKRKAQAKASYERHKDKRNAEIRAKRAADPEPFRAQDRKRDPVKKRASNKASHARHADRINAEVRAKRAANPEPIRAKDNANYAANRKKKNTQRRIRRLFRQDEINAKQRQRKPQPTGRSWHYENREDSCRRARERRQHLAEIIPGTNTGKPWEAWEDEIVMSSRTAKQVAFKLDRSHASVQTRRKKLRKKARGEVDPMMTPRRYRPWTTREDAIVLDDSLTYKDMSRLTERSICAVTQRRWKLKKLEDDAA